jgi:hypothetical protein
MAIVALYLPLFPFTDVAVGEWLAPIRLRPANELRARIGSPYRTQDSVL